LKLIEVYADSASYETFFRLDWLTVNGRLPWLAAHFSSLPDFLDKILSSLHRGYQSHSVLFVFLSCSLPYSFRIAHERFLRVGLVTSTLGFSATISSRVAFLVATLVLGCALAANCTTAVSGMELVALPPLIAPH
jgi:hypothetical protein